MKVANRTGPFPQAELTGERFLVTGSEGCIGSWVAATVAQAGGVAVAADLATEGRAICALLDADARERVRFERCDITAPDAVERLIRKHEITRIVHAAALQIPFVAADPIRGAEVNVMGTVRVLEAARRCRGQVLGIAYASSTAVFGFEDLHRPDTLYGALKACDEACARFYARDYGTPSIGLRPCVVYGPNRDQGLTSALTTAIKAAVLGEPFTVPFAGSIDVQFARDVASTFIVSALADPDGALVFDLHGEIVPVDRFLDVVTAAIPGSAGLLSVGTDTVPGRLEFDDGPLIAFLGPVPKTTIEDGVALTAQVYAHAKATGRPPAFPQ